MIRNFSIGIFFSLLIIGGAFFLLPDVYQIVWFGTWSLSMIAAVCFMGAAIVYVSNNYESFWASAFPASLAIAMFWLFLISYTPNENVIYLSVGLCIAIAASVVYCRLSHTIQRLTLLPICGLIFLPWKIDVLALSLSAFLATTWIILFWARRKRRNVEAHNY